MTVASSSTPEVSGSVLKSSRIDSSNLHSSLPKRTDSDQQTCSRSSESYLYRGHRPESFILKDGDDALMLEWRARQRTFDGAYLRTSLTCSICALFILKLFSRKFDKIGLLYALLSLSILFIIYLRRKRLNHDLSDKYILNQTSENEDEQPLQKKWGREFRTAGDIILILSLIVLTIQISISYIVLQVQDP